MSANAADRTFSGSVAETYEKYFVPLIFEHYAADLAARTAARKPGRVLEVAAGTGVVTRQLAATLPASTAIIATDLNPPMLEVAAAKGTPRPVEWRQADAMKLPFDDASFDAVVCQFGAMFFPVRSTAYAQMRRVLRPGGTLLFNVWDRLEDNEFAHAVMEALTEVFPKDPPVFMAKVPHGYHDLAQVRQDLAKGGFTEAVECTTLAARSRADSPRTVATAYCQGSPMRAEIEARHPPGLAEATQAAEAAIAKRFGQGAVDAKMQAHVITVRK